MQLIHRVTVDTRYSPQAWLTPACKVDMGIFHVYSIRRRANTGLFTNPHPKKWNSYDRESNVFISYKYAPSHMGVSVYMDSWKKLTNRDFAPVHFIQTIDRAQAKCCFRAYWYFFFTRCSELFRENSRGVGTFGFPRYYKTFSHYIGFPQIQITGCWCSV